MANYCNSCGDGDIGVNEYEDEEPLHIPLLEMDPAGYDRQCRRLAELRRERDNEAVRRSLNALAGAAEGEDNMMPLHPGGREGVRHAPGDHGYAARGVWGVHVAGGFVVHTL